MINVADTERKLLDAIDRILARKLINSDGKFTQTNISLEAGVSRATFNRYENVTARYRDIKEQEKLRKSEDNLENNKPKLDFDKSNPDTKTDSNYSKAQIEKSIASARQEIFVLNMAIKMKDEQLLVQSREIAELKKMVASIQELPQKKHLKIVKVKTD